MDWIGKANSQNYQWVLSLCTGSVMPLFHLWALIISKDVQHSVNMNIKSKGMILKALLQEPNYSYFGLYSYTMAFWGSPLFQQLF